MNTLLKTAIAAMILTLAAGTAQAEISGNGTAENGARLNGTENNGRTLNGVRHNARNFNAKNFNARNFNARNFNGVGQAGNDRIGDRDLSLVSIALPDGSLLSAR